MKIPALSILLLIGAPAICFSAGYTQANLSADTDGTATFTDPLLKNPWGLSVAPKRFALEAEWWTSDYATGVSTLYDASGATRQLVVTIPSADGVSLGTPTGTVELNGNFVFVTEDGTVSEWLYDQYINATSANRSPQQLAAAHASRHRSGVQPDTKTNCAGCHVSYANLKVTKPGAAYEGVTLATINSIDTLLAANVNSAQLDAYSTSFTPISLGTSAFVDSQLPSGFTATNVQTAGNLVWVVYVADSGGGYVTGYNAKGKVKVRLQQGAWFDDPWGIALAPSTFGDYSNAILVGNVGSGKIAAFNHSTGAFLGYVSDASGTPITNPGLWALAFGTGNPNNGPTNVLYFTSGTASQTHGLYGSLTANP